jgi:hypothetical protein
MMEGKLDAAIDTLRRAIELDPSNAVARRNLAFAYMKAGDFERGWAELEWRCLLSEEGLRTLDVGRPEWNGCSLKGRTILVRTEQGLGDTIQYVRFLRHLSAEGARVVLQCQGPLVALLKRCPGAHAVIGNGEPVPDIDTHVRLMGIPAILRVVPGTLGNDVPYVHPEEGRRAQWKDVGAGTFAVGIAWQGAKAFEHDTIRSIPLREFIPLIDVPGVTLISLQRGDGTEQLLSK